MWMDQQKVWEEAAVKQTWSVLEVAVTVYQPNCYHFVLPVGIVAAGNEGIFYHFTVQQGDDEVPAVKDTQEFTGDGLLHMDLK